MVHAALGRARLIATSLLAYTEARSAFARKYRSGELDAPALNRLKLQFERDWNRLQRLPLDETTVGKAGAFAEEHALRAFDAIHLASADLLQTALRAAVTFACFDNALNAAARARGLEALFDRRRISF